MKYINNFYIYLNADIVEYIISNVKLVEYLSSEKHLLDKHNNPFKIKTRYIAQETRKYLYV